MSRLSWIFSCGLGMMVAVALSGCASQTDTSEPDTTETSAEAMPDHAEHAEHMEHMEHADHEAHAPGDAVASQAEETDAAATSAEDGEIAAALAELSPEDRAIAEKQKICPVGGDALGSMGKPFKVDLDGRTVFLCCEGCEGLLRADPEKYLAKIDAAAEK